jgi:hypothetical protein
MPFIHAADRSSLVGTLLAITVAHISYVPRVAATGSMNASAM